jgi:hypothetical protein
MRYASAFLDRHSSQGDGTALTGSPLVAMDRRLTD